MHNNSPKVSLGLPVFNGEKFIAKCLDSLLSQSFKDFELIICDNASTDATGEICHNYAKKDSRIIYYRNDKNIGAAANFNLAFKLSRGEYFKWVAHDDICKSEFLEKCVDILENKSNVVLVYSKTKLIDQYDQDIGIYELKKKTDSEDPVVRFSELLIGHMCFEIFGLIRRNMLETTPLIGDYANGDGVLLARLALIGRFEEIPDYLFLSRRHAGQSISMVNDFKAYSAWFNPKLNNKIILPYWKIQLEFLRSINKESNLSIKQRYKCYKHIYWNTLLKKNHIRSDLNFLIKTIDSRFLFNILKKTYSFLKSEKR